MMDLEIINLGCMIWHWGDINMSKYEDFREKALKNPEVKKEYEALKPKYDFIQAKMDDQKDQKPDKKRCCNKQA